MSEKLRPAAAILGQALASLAIHGGEDFGLDLSVDEDEDRVWARTTLPSGDVYELSARWVSEDSP